MVKLNPDQNDDRSKTKTDFDLKKAFDNNNNANTPDPCLAEIHSSNEDDDVYLNVSFNNNSTSNSTDSLSKHKTFNRNERLAKADGGSDGHCSTSENTNEVSSDEIYENYCTAPSTNGPSKLVKVETNGSNNTKTFTKHGINNGKALGNGTLPKDIHTDNSAISDSCSHSSDGANDVTTSSANTVVNDEPDDNVYENIETIREAINKSKTYKKNSNGNRFANENLLVINERKPRQDAINRSASMCATNGDKSDGKTKNHSRSRARVRVRYVMPSAQLSLAEEDVVRLTLEFLHNRGLHISQLSLERETGLVNGAYSDDVLFLRQLILDGQWEDVLEFIQPLGALAAFDMKKFRYIILRHKFIELICIKSETAALTGLTTSTAMDSTVDEMVTLLAEIEKICPTKQDHINLCLLLTLPRLSDHLNFKDWNPSNARVTCFREVYPLVEKFLPNGSGDKKTGGLGAAKNDRLVQLVIKGVLYESCVKYCQIKATGSSESAGSELTFSSLLDNCPGLNESDLSLLSWLQSIPAETFSVPFEQKNLNVDIVRLDKPSLETSWTEHMLITPIKPKTFPHSAMPFTRPRSASDMMSRSLIPGVEFGAGQVSATARSKTPLAAGTGGAGDMMTRSSFASFHLTGMKNSKLMTTSVDKLFENDSDVFLSSSYHPEFGGLPSISELNAKPDQCPPSPPGSSPDHTRGKETSPASSCTTARSSRRDSLSEKNMSAATTVVLSDTLPPSLDPATYDQGDLLKEYQRSKNRMQKSATLESSSSRIMDDSIRSTSSSGNKSISTAASTVTVKSAADPPVHQVPKTNGYNGDTSYEPVKPYSRSDGDGQSNSGRPRFVPVTTLEDAQAVRCAEFHPNGNIYAVGSNSKTLRICAYPKLTDLREEHTTYQPTVLFKRTRHHKGSIYCMAWTPIGDLMATGSNDKTVKLMKFNEETSNLEGQEIELNMHDGTVRDVCFIEDTSNKSSLLISGGAGDCKIYVTDCATGQAFQALSGHSGHVLSLYNWGGAMFISGSHDRTVRFWDLRTRGCTNVLTPITVPGTRQGSPVSALCVDPSGRLMVSGHEDSSCVLYDIRGSRPLQTFKPHTADVRSIRFSPSAYYLLTGGYDNKLVLTDLQGDLTMPLPSVVVASHSDKVISARWHPSEFSFLSTSADKTATLWALPPV